MIVLEMLTKSSNECKFLCNGWMSNVSRRKQQKQHVGQCLLTVSFCWRSEKKKNVNEKLKKEYKSLKSKVVEEERYIKEEKDKMAIEAFENWLVSHTSINIAFESVFRFVELVAFLCFLYCCWRYLYIRFFL